MKPKIAIGILFVAATLIIWAFVDLHLSTKKELRDTQRLLNSGVSLNELERAIGRATHEYPAAQIPEYLKSADGFEERDGTIVRVYKKEGLPYWWVHVQFEADDSEIVWHAIAEQ